MKECPRCLLCLDDAAGECPRDGAPLETAFDGDGIVDGKYRVERRLGAGGMGLVYRARHLGLERDFALKVIRFPDFPATGGRSLAERFRIEARALGKLRHPHIVEVTDYGVDPRGSGLPYLVMEHLEGRTLKDGCALAGPVSVERALPLLDAIAQALDHAHEHGVLHRDLKPGNVFLCGSPAAAPTVKILDFGLARLSEPKGDAPAGSFSPCADSPPGEETVGAFPGTPAYLAPEVIRGQEATCASDVYSLGVLAYEVLVGRPPFTGTPEQVRRAHLESIPPLPSALNPALPPELDPVLFAPLVKEPGRRPRRATDLVAALRCAGLQAEEREWRAREIPRRLKLSGWLAPLIVLLAALLGRWAPVEELERRTVDARFASLPSRPPDPRILLVTIDEATLAADPAPLADRADELSRGLEAVFAAGARGVAIDFLLPERWSRSAAFSRLVLKHADRLTLAAYSAPSGATVGTECVRGLTAVALGPARLSELFGFVNLEEDPDGVIRRGRLSFPDREGNRRASWAARAAGRAGPGEPDEVWIDPSVDGQRLDRISWQDLRGRLAREPALVRGRLVLLGGDFLASGDADHRIPGRAGSPAAVSGVVLQALLVDALLADRPVREAGTLPYLLVTGLACAVLLAAALCHPRPGLAAGLFAGLSGLFVLAAFGVFRELRVLLPMVVPLMAGAFSLGLGLLMRRRLAPVIGLALAVFLCAAPLAADPPAAVAVVASLSGSASVASPPALEKRAVRLFDWLPAGSVIEVGPGSAAVLAFASGHRWELGEKARATLTPGGVSDVSGAMRPLPPLPPLPRIAAIAPSARAGARSGAIRIRSGPRIRGLYPRAGCSTLAGGTVLRFSPREDASRYTVEVEDPGGTVVFSRETASPNVEVPPGILQPGARHHWRVRTLDRNGPTLEEKSEFETLSAEDAQRRAALRAALQDADALALLAEIDRRSGLLAEAREGFRAALERSPAPSADRAIREALDEIERQLAQEGEDAASGVVVEEVTGGSAAEKAGIQPGDLILAWSREAARGEIGSPFDLAEVEIEQSPQGPVTLIGRRGQGRASWTLAPNPWGLRVRPVLPEKLLGPYQEGRDLVRSKRVQEGAARWHVAASEAKRSGERRLAAWLLFTLGRAFAEARMWTEAEEAYREAIAEVDEGAGSTIRALLQIQGQMFLDQGDWARAQDAYRKALAEGQKQAPESLLIAQYLNQLGLAAWYQDDWAVADEYHQHALAIREKLAPGSLEVAGSLNNLGNTAAARGDPETEGYYRRALAIQEKLAPGSLKVADSLHNLGLQARRRGDLLVAEEYYRRALAIREGLAPESLAVAESLNNLGNVADARGDLSLAEEYHRRSLALREKLAPGSLLTAASLNNLGLLARARGDLPLAEEYHRRALAIFEKSAPGSGGVAIGLNNLGAVAFDRGELEVAEEYYRRAVKLYEELAPGGTDFADSLYNLAEVRLARGDLEMAEEYYRRALATRGKLAAGSAAEAESLRGLGLLHRRLGKRGSAAELLRRAIEALEAQNARLGGTQEARSAFGAKYADTYRDYLNTLMDLGRPEEAFHVLERSRARSLLAMLAERDLLFASDLPAEVARERRRNDAEYDRIQYTLSRLSPARDGEEIERLLGRLRELRVKSEEIATRIRKASPRFAALQYPRPLDVAGARRVLDPGTVLLSYSVGAEKTVLFVVQPAGSMALGLPGLSAFTLPVGADALRQKVEAFRRLIERREPADAADAADTDLLAASAADLYRLLVAPAEALIAPGRRLLVSPDGPLQSLPFAALLRGDGRYLVEWKPLHAVVSATVYAELAKSRRPDGERAPVTLAAFGDPRYPSISPERAEQAAEPELRSLLRRGVDLEPLPATRREVESIAGLFPREALKYLGEEATEERAKSLGRSVRYLHFACHGLPDERFPLNSALALTFPESPVDGRDNGLLQAWEIFEQMRIDADLVTLSACGTALGKEMGGEGLVGLVRAFQYAGARSVLASLWGVADESTAELMRLFYGHLKAGKAKDEALRAAQIDLMRKSGFAHPFHWAAFQIIGDWR